MDGNLEQITSEVTSAGCIGCRAAMRMSTKTIMSGYCRSGSTKIRSYEGSIISSSRRASSSGEKMRRRTQGHHRCIQEQQQQDPMDAILSNEGALWWRNQGSGVGSLVLRPAITHQDKPGLYQQYLKEHAAEDEKADGIIHENSELSMKAKNHVEEEEEEKEENDEDEVLLLQSARTRAEVDHPPKSSSTASKALPSPQGVRRLWLPDAPVSQTHGAATSSAASSVFDFTEADATPLRRSRLTIKRRTRNGRPSDRDHTGSEEVDDFSTMTTMEHVKRVLYGDSL